MNLAIVRVGVREVARVANGRVVDDDYVVRVVAHGLVDGGRHVHMVVVQRDGRVQVVRAAAVVTVSVVATTAAAVLVVVVRRGAEIVRGTREGRARAQRILRLVQITGTVSN
jgi:hypothetical protein